MRRGLSPFLIVALTAGFVFLYGPILLVIGYSFNASKLVTVWGGFSFHWYGEVFRNRQLLDAVLVSLQVGVLSATIATVAGTMTALVLTRYARFAGRALFAGFSYAPLVLPEVITALSLLLLFVELDWDRGIGTIAVAQAVFASAWVAVLVQSRLLTLDPAIEEAAMDLGATPARMLLTVTLPVIAPTLAVGWLLAFTLSIDDLVIASFASGPGSTTLPMRIYGQARLGVTPEINAVATLMIATVAVLAVSASLLAKFGSAKKRQELGSK